MGSWLNSPTVGTVSGRLISIAAPFRRNGYTYVSCRCDCGNETDVRRDHFLTKGTRSCGCWEAEVRFSRRLETGIAARNHVLKGYTKQAKKRGLEWSLTRSEFFELTSSDCHYCGCPPSNTHEHGRFNGSVTYNGVDRRDNAVGYTLENVVPCCAMCNHAKATHSVEAFEAWIDRLVAHRTCKPCK